MIRVAYCRYSLLTAIGFAVSAASLHAADSHSLADACERRDGGTISALLSDTARGTSHAAQPDGTTALHWAVHHDDVDLVARLLRAGALADAPNNYGVTPLALACQAGHEQIVRLLLDAGADVHQETPGQASPLLIAARTGRPGAITALLAHGAKANATEHHGQTPLMWAAAEGHVDAVDLLLKAGADPEVRLRSGFTACLFAAREGRRDVVRRLLAAGVDVNQVQAPARAANDAKGTSSVLLLAVENAHFELADELLRVGADPNLAPAGYTALHAITWVRKPIRGDGDPPPTGSGRMTSLDFARRLVASGANLNARLERGTGGRGRFNTNGATPFLLAARASDLPLMTLLLELGADPHIPNVDNTSPLLAAAGVGALGDGDEAAATEPETMEAVRYLIDLGLDVNAVDDNGETAMHGAAYQSWPDVVRLLVLRGADARVWHTQNKLGWTPLKIAEGHRPGNFRPAPDTIAAIHEMLRANGIDPPPPTFAPDNNDEYSNRGKQRPKSN